MKTKITLVMFLLIALTFNACKKPKDGEDGPQGLQGPAGNANVQGSQPYSATFITSNGNLYYVNINAPLLTQDILDKGVVMVYTGGVGDWWPLPLTANITTTYFNIKLNLVTIYIRNTDGSTTPNPGTKTFRNVYISASNRMAHPNLDLTNYEEVKKALNLKD